MFKHQLISGNSSCVILEWIARCCKPAPKNTLVSIVSRLLCPIHEGSASALKWARFSIQFPLPSKVSPVTYVFFWTPPGHNCALPMWTAARSSEHIFIWPFGLIIRQNMVSFHYSLRPIAPEYPHYPPSIVVF